MFNIFIDTSLIDKCCINIDKLLNPMMVILILCCSAKNKLLRIKFISDFPKLLIIIPWHIHIKIVIPWDESIMT